MSTLTGDLPTPEELAAVERQVMEARDALDHLRHRLGAYAGEAWSGAKPAPTFADLGALWAFADVTGNFAKDIAETLGEVAAAMRELDNVRGSKALAA